MRLRPDPTAHRLDELTADEQADPGSGGDSRCIRRPIEQVEHAARVRVAEADALVEHPDDRLVVGVLGVDPDRGRRRAVLCGVRQEIPDYLFDVRLFAPDKGQLTVDLEVEAAIRLPSGLDIDDPAQEATEVEGLIRDLDTADLGPGQDEEVLDQPMKSIGLGLDVLDGARPDLRRQ